MAKIESVEALRAVLGPSKPTTFAKILPRVEPQGAEFLRVCPFAVVSTVDAQGVVESSPKGDLPGFIRLEDDRTLLIPERAGNNLAFGLQNILANGRIGGTVRIADAPWLIETDRADFSPLAPAEALSPTLGRLFALGVDAARLVLVAGRDVLPSSFDGAIGKLALKDAQYRRQPMIGEFRERALVKVGP